MWCRDFSSPKITLLPILICFHVDLLCVLTSSCINFVLFGLFCHALLFWSWLSILRAVRKTTTHCRKSPRPHRQRRRLNLRHRWHHRPRRGAVLLQVCVLVMGCSKTRTQALTHTHARTHTHTTYRMHRISRMMIGYWKFIHVMCTLHVTVSIALGNVSHDDNENMSYKGIRYKQYALYSTHTLTTSGRQEIYNSVSWDMFDIITWNIHYEHKILFVALMCFVMRLGPDLHQHMSPWRNRLARSAVNRKVGGSSPPGDGFLFFPFFSFCHLSFVKVHVCVGMCNCLIHGYSHMV